jgi:hypothetical protein
MSGLPAYNFPAFDAAAADLRARGIEVFSPAESDRELDGFDPWKDEAESAAHYMARDLPEVCKADAVVLLPGWQGSHGARLEAHVGRAVGKQLLRYPDLARARHPYSERIHELLELAGETHDRKQLDYGTDNDPLANVRSSEAFGVPAWIGCMIRANDKVKRLQAMASKGELANESAEDSFLDLAVYALIGRVLYEEATVGGDKA